MADYSKEVDVLLFGLVDAVNKLHDAFCSKDGYDTYHRDITSVVGGDFRSPTLTTVQVTAPTAADLPTTSTMANQLFAVLHTHFLDDSAHLIADTFSDGYMTANTSLSFPGDADSLTVVRNKLNVMKHAFNGHLEQAGVHIISDVVNDVSASDATDLSSAETLANALKTAVNAHVGSGPKDIDGNTIPRVRTRPK